MARAQPVLFLPKFSTLAGAASFTSVPLDVSALESIQIVAWRGALRGTDPTFQVILEESMDAEVWTAGAVAATGYDPGADTTKQLRYCFELRWFRVRVELGGTDPMVTCWVEGLMR